MDLNHDYNGTNELLVAGSTERLQTCKCVLLSFGDLGYTDPTIPDISSAIGEFTDSQGIESLETAIYNALIISQVVRDDEIIGIHVISGEGSNQFTVDLQLTFGETTFDLE